MGALTTGKTCIIIQGNDFGKKIKIKKLDSNNVYYDDGENEKKINILHIFPIE